MTIQIFSQNEFLRYVLTHLFFLFSNLTEIFSNVISLRELFEVAATPKSQQKPDAMDSITLVELVTMKDKEIKETLKLGMHIYVSVCRSVSEEIFVSVSGTSQNTRLVLMQPGNRE